MGETFPSPRVDCRLGRVHVPCGMRAGFAETAAGGSFGGTVRRDREKRKS